MTETRAYYGIPAQQAAFLDSLRAACPMPIAALADWEPKAEAVGLRLWLREERGDLVLDWERVAAG